MVVIDCAYPGCAFQSEDAPEAVACAILQSHAFSHATPGPNSVRAPSEGPKLTRPSIDVGVSLEAWNVFTRRWQMFRQGSGINEASATAQLFQCASQSLGDSLLKSDAKIVSKPLQELLSAMRRLAVIPVATGVLRSDLMQMRQLRDEPFRAFAARVRGKADTCAFTIDCTCGLKINYTDHMIRDTLLNGIADDEIRREILGGADILTRAVNEIVALVESKEMARNAVPPTEVTSVSAVRRLHDADHRACRNATPCRESHNLPDRSKQSRCPLCQQLFQLYKKGPRGWNTKPYTLCIECYRSQKRRRRQLTHKVGPSPPEPGLQTLEVTSPADPQLSSIRTNHRPVSRHRPNKCNTPLSAVHRNATMQGPHYIFKDGQWATARMREHPKVQVTISVDRAQAHGESTSVRAANVTAIADTGAQVNVWSLDEFVKYGFPSDILTPASNLVAANHSSISIVGAFFAIIEGLSCHGYVVQCRAMVYISADIQTLFLSHGTLSTLGVLSPSFPSLGEHAYAETQECAGEPAAITNAHLTRAVTGGCASPGDQNHSCTCPQRTAVPPPPRSLPFRCTPENNDRIKTWLLERYASSTFNTCPHRPLHCMAGPPIEIHVSTSAKPRAFHTPASIPLHWQQQVHADLLRDEALGILEKVPHGEPTQWCHRMVITRKHDGTPRRTVDLSPLNKFCRRETFVSETPFKLARRVPSNTWKSVTDAWNGYHSVPLRESDRHLTTFITPFGRWRYTRAPQGFLSSGDGYNRRFAAILSDFMRKERCVDDTVFFDENLEEHWWRTIQFLTLVGRSGIVLNPSKFQFAQRSVDFAGFRISESCVEPLPKYLNAIQQFPTPKNIKDIRSWFGLINQVANYAKIRDLMAPFKPFLSPKRKFEWNDNLDKAFARSKDAIIDAIRHGVEIFDPTRRTCLRPDWSNRGIGYFLLQKHCACPSTLPDCCANGWRVTLAGSRFLSSAEQRYAPIEGEALAVAWGLEQTKYFTQGCDNLVVVTDHKPLTKIFGDRTLDEISNTRLFRLKQRTLMWRFDIAHLPGSTNIAADAASRHPATSFFATISGAERDSIDSLEEALLASVRQNTRDQLTLNWDEIAQHTASDAALNDLLSAIQSNFDVNLPPEGGIRQYLPYRNGFYISDGVILYNDRVVIPPQLRYQVLRTLHAAHQGVSAMERRARATVFWPGMTQDIHNIRDSCAHCNRNAPSQAATPRCPPTHLPRP